MYLYLCTIVGHNFGSHMTPAEFNVSSDALLHLQISMNTSATAVEQLACALPSKQKLAVEVKVQQTGNVSTKIKMYYEYLMR